MVFYRHTQAAAEKLEGAFSGGKPEELGIVRFPLKNTLLEKCTPLQVPYIPGVSRQNPSYRFLQVLVQSQRQDAIFLPVTSQGPIPGVLVFATRKAHAYQPEHTQPSCTYHACYGVAV